jgi:mannitol-1-/sugar-/sorbitol-6-/2-deoxyglucose-6-phosphatase
VLRAAIFDLDGLLVDSEPLWRRAEIERFAEVGLHLDDAACAETTGLRIDEVVALRHRQQPWQAPSVAEVTERIVARMAVLLREEASAMPGAARAVELCREAGLRLAVASSSPERLIEAALARLGLRGRFELVLSAEHEPYGKPHPAVFLRTAERLGVAPGACLVFEDSLHGLVAAKAARMTCVAVPELHRPDATGAKAHDPRFALADRVLGSLEALDAGMLAQLAQLAGGAR